MGIEKNAMIEAEDRGWRIPEGYVCPDCVEDKYLKDVIRDDACHRECDYCGGRTRKHSAAPVMVIMEQIGNTIFTWFDNPEEAGGFWDNEDGNYYGFDAINTSEMLESIPLECNEKLFEEIAESFVNDQWVETANGSIYGSHPHELMSYAWERFAQIVKYESRYFFQQTLSNIEDEEDEYQFARQENYNPANFLPILGELAIKLRLFTTLSIGETLFRARPKKEGESFDLNTKELGAPPSQKAAAGRMNPAGISYMYLAFEQDTALTEVRQSNGLLQAAIGRFETQRETHILDLTNLPEKPSIFDDQCHDELVGLLFIDEFVKEIIKPVEKNGSEYIEYVPSQVVSEFFALIFRLQNDIHLDGIKYPSAVHKDGYNLVLFPTERGYELLFNQVEFQEAWWDCPA